MVISVLSFTSAGITVNHCCTDTHTHTRAFNGPFSRTTRVILPKQETVSGNGISWAICKSAPCSRQITMPAPHYSVFYRPDALPAAQPTVSKHCTAVQIIHSNRDWQFIWQKVPRQVLQCFKMSSTFLCKVFHSSLVCIGFANRGLCAGSLTNTSSENDVI